MDDPLTHAVSQLSSYPTPSLPFQGLEPPHLGAYIGAGAFDIKKRDVPARTQRELSAFF